MAHVITAPPATHPPSNAELFRGFLILGVTGFGGVLPLARRMMVEDRHWLTDGEFTDLLGLCQFLPGGNIINMSVAVKLKFGGWTGALSSILGLIAAPTAIIIGLGLLYDRFQSDPQLEQVFAGLAAAAAGLLKAMAIKIVWPLRDRPAAIALVTVCVLAIAMFRLPLIIVMLVMAPLAIFMNVRLRS